MNDFRYYQGMDFSDFLAHYGVGHEQGGHSGRYAWGSGERPWQRTSRDGQSKFKIAKDKYKAAKKAYSRASKDYRSTLNSDTATRRDKRNADRYLTMREKELSKAKDAFRQEREALKAAKREERKAVSDQKKAEKEANPPANEKLERTLNKKEDKLENVRNKDIGKMTDKELNDRIQRLRAEDTYRQLIGQKTLSQLRKEKDMPLEIAKGSMEHLVKSGISSLIDKVIIPTATGHILYSLAQGKRDEENAAIRKWNKEHPDDQKQLKSDVDYVRSVFKGMQFVSDNNNNNNNSNNNNNNNSNNNNNNNSNNNNNNNNGANQQNKNQQQNQSQQPQQQLSRKERKRLAREQREQEQKKKAEQEASTASLKDVAEATKDMIDMSGAKDILTGAAERMGKDLQKQEEKERKKAEKAAAAKASSENSKSVDRNTDNSIYADKNVEKQPSVTYDHDNSSTYETEGSSNKPYKWDRATREATAGYSTFKSESKKDNRNTDDSIYADKHVEKQPKVSYDYNNSSTYETEGSSNKPYKWDRATREATAGYSTFSERSSSENNKPSASSSSSKISSQKLDIFYDSNPGQFSTKEQKEFSSAIASAASALRSIGSGKITTKPAKESSSSRNTSDSSDAIGRLKQNKEVWNDIAKSVPRDVLENAEKISQETTAYTKDLLERSQKTLKKYGR